MRAGFGGQSQQRWGDNTLNRDEYMQDLLLSDTQGVSRATAKARKAGMVVMAFFKTGCPTCQLTFPYLQKLADAYQETGKLTVWGVSQDDDETTEAFAANQGISFPLLLDRDLYQSMNYGLTNVPTIYLVNPDGLVLHKVVGWNREAINTISREIAAFAEVDPVAIVATEDPVVAIKPG